MASTHRSYVLAAMVLAAYLLSPAAAQGKRLGPQQPALMHCLLQALSAASDERTRGRADALRAGLALWRGVTCRRLCTWLHMAILLSRASAAVAALCLIMPVLHACAAAL